MQFVCRATTWFPKKIKWCRTKYNKLTTTKAFKIATVFLSKKSTPDILLIKSYFKTCAYVH